MNTEWEIAAYRRVIEEISRFGRILDEREREEAAYLEMVLRLECGENDASLRALGELGRGGSR